MTHDLDEAAAVAGALGPPLPGDLVALITPCLRPGESVFDGLRRAVLHHAWIAAYGNQEQMAAALRISQNGVNHALRSFGDVRPVDRRKALRVA